MDEEKLLPDFLLAITIMGILFWFMIVVSNTLNLELEPIHEPICRDRHQLTTKAVLGCPDD